MPGPELRWTVEEELLHALAAGATAAHRVWEGAPSRPFASFLATLAFRSAGPWLAEAQIDAAQAMIGEVELVRRGPWPAARAARVHGELLGRWDLGPMALVRVRQAFDTEAGPLGEVTLGIYVRGAGGFGGPRPPRAPRERLPDAPPESVPVALAANAALLYRLLGDPNPLHVDPAAAARFPDVTGGRPIAHGLLGVAAVERALEDRFGVELRAARLRLNRPLWPGEGAELLVWRSGGAPWPVRLRAHDDDAWTAASVEVEPGLTGARDGGMTS